MATDMKSLCGSVTKIGSTLVITVPGDLEDSAIRMMTEDILKKAGRWDVNGAVMDFSPVQIMDTYMFNVFNDTSSALKLLGVESIWANLSPMVVVSIMELIDFEDKMVFQTAINLEQGMIFLEERRGYGLGNDKT